MDDNGQRRQQLQQTMAKAIMQINSRWVCGALTFALQSCQALVSGWVDIEIAMAWAVSADSAASARGRTAQKRAAQDATHVLGYGGLRATGGLPGVQVVRVCGCGGLA